VQVGVAPVPRGHALPQAPQLFTSLASIASHPSDAIPLQSAAPLLHMKPHMRPLHVRVAFVGLGHEFPHAPHEAGSSRLASHPFDGFESQLPNPAAHCSPHVLIAHVAVAWAAFAHTNVQLPQRSGSLRVSTSHPFAALPSQSANPDAHVMAQVPAVHDRVLFGPAGQTVPHVPQFSASVSRFVHVVPHRSGVAPTQPLTQTVDPLLDPHMGVPPLHIAPQAPQLLAVVRLVSQPSLASPLQSANPALHERFRLHAPPMHCTEPADTFANIVQSFPQLPQWCTSVLGSTQLAPQTSPSQPSTGTSTTSASATSIASSSITSRTSIASIPSGTIGTSTRSMASPVTISLPSRLTTSTPE
jgi:hypothetical protein